MQVTPTPKMFLEWCGSEAGLGQLNQCSNENSMSRVTIPVALPKGELGLYSPWNGILVFSHLFREQVCCYKVPAKEWSGYKLCFCARGCQHVVLRTNHITINNYVARAWWALFVTIWTHHTVLDQHIGECDLNLTFLSMMIPYTKHCCI